MSSQLSNTVLNAYQKLAYMELHAETIFDQFLPPLNPNRKRPTRWQKLRWRWKRRWERLLNWRIINLEDYRIEYARY